MNLPRVFGFVLAATTSAYAQCDLQPTATGRGVPSLVGFAYSSCEWDPDGAGPVGPQLVVSGAFQLAGDLPVQGIAMFDLATGEWSRLGVLEGLMNALMVLPNGVLVAGGQCESPAPTSSLLQFWTGTAWSTAVPQPPGFSVVALASAPNGDLVASCSTGTGCTVQRLGANGWQVLGTLAPRLGGPNYCLAADLVFDGNGDLLIAGAFGAVDSVAAENVARWDGSDWSALGPGVDGYVRDLLITSSGELYAGGQFGVGGAPQGTNVARWNGTSWQPLGTGMRSPTSADSGVFALAEVPGGIVAGGQFTAAGGAPAYKVAQWNGSAWSAMGGGIEQYGPFSVPSVVMSLVAASNGELFAAGTFAYVSGFDGRGVARWNGTSWRPLRPVGIGAPTVAVHRSSTGDVFLGGAFRSIDGVLCNGIARRTASGWQPLGGGIDPYPGYNPSVGSIVRLPDGSLVVGGRFPGAGGVEAVSLALWNGSAWESIGGGLAFGNQDPRVDSLHVDARGDLYVAGLFGTAGGVAVESLARWNGSQWSAVGAGLLTGAGQSASITDVVTSPLGDVFVAGQFTLGGASTFGKLAVYSGGAWQLLGVSDGVVHDLQVSSSGDLLVAGSFHHIGGIQVGQVARWSNGTWSAVGGLGVPGPGFVRRVCELPGGGLLAAGQIEHAGTYYRFARWEAGVWTLFDPIVLLGVGPEAWDLAVDPSGEVLVAGNFTEFGGVASSNLLRLVPPCLATATASGAGCVGSGGPNVLTTKAKPWLGTIFVADASGLPTHSVGMMLLGLGVVSVPLPSLLPQGGAGCELLVTPDALLPVMPSIGQALVPIALPLVPALVGCVLHLQVVPIELGASGAITSVTSTNRLSLVLGVF